MKLSPSKALSLYIIRDRGLRNQPLTNREDLVLTFSSKRLAKESRDEANLDVIKALPEEKRDLARLRKQRFYISPGPDHKKFRGGRK